jgi:putative AlgH/UPF0301 family transcriptional regulator
MIRNILRYYYLGTTCYMIFWGKQSWADNCLHQGILVSDWLCAKGSWSVMFSSLEYPDCFSIDYMS